MKYEYVAWKDEGIWTVHSPSVPGVYGLGGTFREAERDYIEALDTLTDYLSEINEPLPAPISIKVGSIEIEV